MNEIIKIKKWPTELQVETKDGFKYVEFDGDDGEYTRWQYKRGLMDVDWSESAAEEIVEYLYNCEGDGFFVLSESDPHLESIISGGIFTFNADPCCVEAEHIECVAQHIRVHGITKFRSSEVDEEEFKVWCNKLDIDHATAIYKADDNSMLLVLPEDIR